MSRKNWQLLLLVLLSSLVITVLVSAFDTTSLIVGRCLNDTCPEHDTFLAHALQSVPTQTLASGWEANYDFDIVATHPITKAVANGLPSAQWCAANFTGCPASIKATTTELVANDIKVYDDGNWVISTLDISGNPTSMMVRFNNINYGQHNALVFNRHRTPTADTWPQFFVLYANGFIRLKPMGKSDAQTDDPCFGTSAVLGPYQFTAPLLAGAPHPELHPILDQADIYLTGTIKNPSLMLTGRFVNSSTTTLMKATWLISTTRVDAIETRLNVQQHIIGTEKLSFQSISGNGVLGIASLSGMWVDTDTHDADTLRLTNESGQIYQVYASDIKGVPFGETLPISLIAPYTLSLVTTSSTDHNVGSPDMHIYLRQAFTVSHIFLPIIGNVLLQGRHDYQYSQISLNETACSPSPTGSTVATTDTNGHFEINLPDSPSYQCLYVQQAGYLAGQRVAPNGNLGEITLLAGDMNQDGQIDIFDLAIVGSRYKSSDATADLNQDGIVNIFDLSLVGGNYQKHGPITDWQ